MFGLAQLFVYVFFCPFSILITLLGVGCGFCLWLFLDYSIYLLYLMKQKNIVKQYIPAAAVGSGLAMSTAEEL